MNYKKIAKKIATPLIKCSVSKTMLFSPFRWVAKWSLFTIFWILKDRAYSAISLAVPDHRPSSQNPPSSYQLLFFFMQALLGDKSTSTGKYQILLSKVKPTPKIAFKLMADFTRSGRLDLAQMTALYLLHGNYDPFVEANYLKICRNAGMVFFLSGQNKEANYYWGLAGMTRIISYKATTPKKYRILGPSWFGALGHVAMLDYYLKYKRLYGQEDHRIVALPYASIGCMTHLMHKFSELGITMLRNHEELPQDYNEWAKNNHAPLWHQLTSAEQEVLVDDFWEHEFPDGSILSYTHAAARIQKDWEQSHRPPLLSVTCAEKIWLTTFLEKLGIPPNTWFVCLHVREGGFHRSWNVHHPQMRDANIEDYYPAIQEIVKAGGWVFRMGDPSMKPIQPMPNVIDYAHSPHRTPLADLVLAASCKFFLGTNSGLATIPAIYGVPCALSNWVPIGWPLWPSQDLIICKLYRDRATGRLFSLEEMFQRGLAFLQKFDDLPKGIDLIDNTSEDIRQLTREMLSRCQLAESPATNARDEIQAYYKDLAHRYHTFTGGLLAHSFVQNYPEVFQIPQENPIALQETYA